MSDLLKAYNVLGLEPGSDKQSIQARYKRLVLVWHPDRFPSDEGKADAEEELKRIVNAKDLLVKHFDSGKHKASGCECGQPASATSGSNHADPAAAAARRFREAATRNVQEPSSAQKKRWAELEREFEYELRADEIEIEKKAVEWFAQQKREEKEAAETKRRARTRNTSKVTIQDQLDAARGGKAVRIKDDKTVEMTQALLDEWKSIVLSPIDYFESMPLSGGLKEPALFAGVISAINAVAWFLVTINHPMQAVQIGVGSFVLLFGGSFVIAAGTQKLSDLLGGDGDFEATYRACAYSMAPNVLLWIPIISFFAWLYSLFLFKLALASAQDLPATRCNVIIGILVAIPALFGVVAFLFGVSKVVSTMFNP